MPDAMHSAYSAGHTGKNWKSLEGLWLNPAAISAILAVAVSSRSVMLQ